MDTTTYYHDKHRKIITTILTHRLVLQNTIPLKDGVPSLSSLMTQGCRSDLNYLLNHRHPRHLIKIRRLVLMTTSNWT